MRRREFIGLAAACMLFGGAGFTTPAWAQQPSGRRRVGLLLFSGNPDGSMNATTRAWTDAVRAGLKEEGFIDGVNIILDVRLGLNDNALTRAGARDLVGSGC